MLCSNCGCEMKSGYTAHPNLNGTVRITKATVRKKGMPLFSVCPNCGKVEVFVDLRTVEW